MPFAINLIHYEDDRVSIFQLSIARGDANLQQEYKEEAMKTVVRSRKRRMKGSGIGKRIQTIDAERRVFSDSLIGDLRSIS